MELGPAIAAVKTAVGALRTVDLDGAGTTDIRSALRELKVTDSQLDAQLARFTHAADASGAFIGTGSRDTAEWLGKETGTSTHRNRASATLGEAMSKSDELTNAVTAGTLSSEKAAAAVGAARGRAVDSQLLDEIAELPLHAVKPATEAWRARNDNERERDAVATQQAQRYLRLTGRADGMTTVEGLLDPASAAAVRTTLDAVMNESAFDGMTRSRDQRCADALTQLAVAASKGKIAGGRSNAKILATVPFETITERASARGVAHAGPTLDADSVRKLACDAGIHRVVTGPGSSTLNFGHESRLVSENLFLALVARDQQCRWPGCAMRATWCDAHHVIEWDDQHGQTSEQDCALLCNRHHHIAHLPGWAITGDGHEFTIHHPDGSTEVSTPPGVRTAGAGAACSDSRYEPPPNRPNHSVPTRSAGTPPGSGAPASLQTSLL